MEVQITEFAKQALERIDANNVISGKIEHDAEPNNYQRKKGYELRRLTIEVEYLVKTKEVTEDHAADF